jgi:hypothetical protein
MSLISTGSISLDSTFKASYKVGPTECTLCTDLFENFCIYSLKVHKIEIFFYSDFGICIISLLVMSTY